MKKATKKPRVKLSVQVLQRARQILTKKGWTKNTYARDKHGEDVHYNNSSATQFCILGASLRAGVELARAKHMRIDSLTQPARDNIAATCMRLHNATPVIFNDYIATTKQDVIAVIDAAINAETN